MGDRLLEIGEELASWIAVRRGVEDTSVSVILRADGCALRILATVDGREDDAAAQAVARLLSCGADASKILSEKRKASGLLWEVP